MHLILFDREGRVAFEGAPELCSAMDKFTLTYYLSMLEEDLEERGANAHVHVDDLILCADKPYAWVLLVTPDRRFAQAWVWTSEEEMLSAWPDQHRLRPGVVLPTIFGNAQITSCSIPKSDRI
jgi:hypothetical protein